MSDRNATIVGIADRLQKTYWSVPQGRKIVTTTKEARRLKGGWLQCRAVVAVHTTENGSFSEEHGPFAGVGYYEDMMMAIRARDGLIGGTSTSTLLVQEVIEYDRQMDALTQQRSSMGSGQTLIPTKLPLDPLPSCNLPRV